MSPPPEHETAKDTDDIDAYYQEALGSKTALGFQDLDDSSCLESSLRRLETYSSRNFILDFSSVAARTSFDLSTATLEALLNAHRPESLCARWINVWQPQHQEPLIKLLAKRYNFSPRLLALMTSDPRQPRQNHEQDLKKHHSLHERLDRHRSHRLQPQSDIERGSDELSNLSTVESHDSISKGNLYRIINDIWHYSSIDFGRSYVCLGYNSLYGVKDGEYSTDDTRLPHAIRLWTFLIVCEDNTVISINEDPFPLSDGRLDLLQQRILHGTRRNLVDIFRSLSKVDEDALMDEKPLTLYPIRVRLGGSTSEDAVCSPDMPGLLFYYLFENWHNSYSLITRRESRYATELKSLRNKMFEQPQLAHINRLDTIGTELGILKNHFESYNRLIDRLLEPRTISNASLRHQRIATESSQASIDTVRRVAEQQENTLGVSLSSPARVRFERLKDLIDLYALTEVNEYIKQKESLVGMVSCVPSFTPYSTVTANVHVYRTSSSSLSKSPSMSRS